MKNSKLLILLLAMVMILAISAVSAADTNDTSDSVAQAVDEAPVEEVSSEDVDALAATDNTDVLADVGNNFTSLQSSIDTGTVVMDRDYARVEGESTLSISKDVTIEGNGHKIDGSNLGGIFNVNSGCTLTLNGVTLINGNAENGGAVYNNGGTLAIENSYFINNTATKSGGAIYNNGGTLNVIGSTFDGNDLTDRSVNGYGGAAIYSAAGDVTISTSRITNNLKDIVHRGGTGAYTGDLSSAAVSNKNGALTVTDSIFESNSGSYGGAILSQGTTSSLIVSGSNFNNNFAFNGGAIYCPDGNYHISKSNFTGNKVRGTGSTKTSYAHGGAIAATETASDCIISDCVFKDNSATMGGAISTTDTQVIGCTFINNTAQSAYAESFNGKTNNVGGYGAATYSDKVMIIDGSTFINNTNTRNENVYLRNATVTNSVFVNTIVNVNRGPLTISNNTYDNAGKDIAGGNSPSIYFDGVGDIPYVTNGKVYFDVSSFADLQAMIDSGSTGGIYLTGDITKLDSEYETFANGIYINRSVSIYGEGFTISSNNGKVFNVDSAGSLTINNAEIAGDGTAAITNDGTVSVGLTTNFTNVGDYAIENNGRVSQSSLTTFTQLNNLIALVSGGEVYIGSSKITKADDEKATFADGIIVEKDLTITGYANNKRVISTYLDAANSGRIFSVNDGAILTLNKMILKNGNAENGGAVYVEANNNLIANTVDFIDNVASEYDGGAIYTVGGTIALTDCVLDGNDVTKLETSASQSRGGAAIYAKDAQLTLVNTNVTNNGRSELDRTKGDLVNAVINLINSNAAITGGLFENNTGIYGGAIFADGDGSQTLTVSGATFKNNKAYNGGAIDISSMITDISDCTFDNNWVVGPGSTGYYGLGGAVATDGSGSFSLTGSNFTGNKATGLNASAGAVSVGLDQGCPATIDDCVFKENTAELKGGAVFIAGYDDDATISNCNFSDDNTAEIGGSLYNGGNLKLTNNVIEGDSGIYSSGAGKIDTHVWVIVNDNQDVTVEYYDTIPIVVKITDDNGNLIRIDEPTLTIDLGDQWTRQTLTLDEATGFYTMDNYLVDQKSGLLTPSRTTIGKYFASYNANTNLNSSYITMIKANASMEVTYQNVSRPDDVVITINVTGKEGAPKISWAPTTATPFKVTVNDVEYKVRITNGIGTLTIPDLPAGEYIVNASWGGNTKYNPIEPTTSILKVSNLNVTKFTVETIGKYLSDDNVTLFVTLLGLNDEGLNETFNVIVNNTEYAVTVTNGTGTLNISGLAPGHYSALGIFPGNNNYNGAYATGLFTVLYPSPILNVTAEDITYGEDVILNITLTEADGTPIDGGIGIDVGGKFSLDISINGFASIHVPNLPANESGWAIAVYYYGDDEHLNAQNLTETVKVAKATPTVDITGPSDINIGEDAEFTATVDAKVDGIALNIWVDGVNYISMGPGEWDSNVAKFMITSDWLTEARDYNITVQFIGNENYTASENVSQILTVDKIDVGTIIQISGSTVTYGENATVTVELPMDAEGNVTVTIEGVTFNGTVEGGIAVVEIPGLGVGLYEMFAVDYSGDNKYASHSGMATVEVKQAKSSVEIKPIEEVTYGNNVTIEYTVLNATTIKINVATEDMQPVYYLTFDSNDTEYGATLELSNVVAGKYIVVVENDGNDNYTFSAAEARFTVNKAEPTMQTEISQDIKAGDANVVVEVVLPEDATGKVMLLIDGEVVYPMGSDLINGTVNITVPADFVNAGKRSYYVSYDGDDNYLSTYDYKSFEVSKVDPMVLIAVIPNNETKEPAAISIFVGNVTGGLTVARATGQILIEGYGVARLVDLEDGIYTLELIDIVPGDYEITVTYLGDDNFNNATNSTEFAVPKRAATVEITDVTKNIKYGQDATFTVNMNPDSANGNVTIYINGSEYATVVLDDEYANATVSIPNLVVGTYTIGVKYNGNDYYNASDVANTTVTVAKADVDIYYETIIGEIKYGEDAIIYVDINPNLATGNVTIFVNDDEYGTYVLDKDYANATIALSGLAVGNYNVTVTYNGDENYNARTGVIPTNTINVEKAGSKVTIEPIENVKYPQDVWIEFSVENKTSIRIKIYNSTGGNITDFEYDEDLGLILIKGLVPDDYGVYIFNDDTDSIIGDMDDAYFTVNWASSTTKIIQPIENVEYGNNVTVYYEIENRTEVIVYIMDEARNTTIITENVFDDHVVLPNLTVGTYTILVVNNFSDIYGISWDTAEFKVVKAVPAFDIGITDDIKALEEGVEIKVKLPADADGIVSVIVDGKQITVGGKQVNGTLNVTVPSELLAAGNHSFIVTFTGDKNYEDVSGYAGFEVTKLDPLVVIVILPNTTEPATASIFVGDMVGESTLVRATGKILIEGYGLDRLVDLEDGIYNLDLIDIVAGDYEITVTYLGDDNFNNASNSTQFTVPKSDVKIGYETVTPEIKYGEDAVIKVDIDPDFATGNVTIFVDNNEYGTFVLDDDYANATIIISGLAMGSHNITVTYNGDENYNPITGIAENAIIVTKGQPTIDIMLDHDVIEVGSEISVIYGIFGEVDGGNISICIDGVECYNKPIDGAVNYIDIVSDLLTPGNHTVSAQYLGDDLNLPSDIDKVNVTVLNKSQIIIDIDNPENSTDLVFNVTLPSDAEGYLFVDIADQHYYAPVKNGTATISVPGLAPGNYTTTITYSGDDQYENITLIKNVTVPSNLPENAITVPETADTDSPVTYAINLPADAGGYLEVDVDGTKYIAALNNGSASVTVPALSEGEHNVTVKYSGDGKYSSASKDTKLSVHVPVYNIAENKDVSAIYSATASYKVLITKDGKAVGAGESVTIKYNGKTYTVKTDSKGYATLKLNTKVKVKKYTITAEYKGVKVTNKVTIKHVIKAKNKKVKKSRKVTKVKITMNKVNGKVLAKKTLKVKFRGKVYKVKTNKKGVATWKVKKSMIKVKVGKKYKYKVTYGKDVVTKKLTIKK